jgi:serine/threonine-protein kinase
MTPERYRRLCELFDQAQAWPANQRATFLHEVSAADPALRADLEKLLADDRKARVAQLLAGACPVNAKALLADDRAAVAGPEGAPALPGAENALQSTSPPRLQTVVAAGAEPGLARDLQTLLHRRLRWATLLVLAVYTYYAIVVLQQLVVGNLDYLHGKWFHFSCNSLILVTSAVLTTFLWRKRELPLKQLRLIELVLLGLVLTDMARNFYDDFIVAHHMARRYGSARIPGEGEHILFLYSSAYSLEPFIIIAAYATLIPSGWRRCTVVVSLTALIPLSLCAAAGLSTLPDPWTFLLYFLLPMGIFLTVAVGIAAYGTHRIELLRQEAAEARKLGQYQLKQRLGTGGMGEVYLAEHVLLKQPCAVKLIRPERAGDSATLRRFEREVQATARLKHWNTVQIYDYGHAADGTFYYVMEYLPGPTLEQLVTRRGPLPPARAIHLLQQACAALREAHAMGLIHRDIKPANMMVCERGGIHDVVKLLDFGLVKAVGLDSRDETLTQQGAIAGTPAYMSPEQASGNEQLDARADVYSLGAVAYFLLTGQPPFRRDKAIQLILAQIHEPARPLTELRPDVPLDLQDVVLRCLEKAPARRFADVSRLHDALTACTCAGQWTEEMAAQWQQARVGDENAGTDASMPALYQPPDECTGQLLPRVPPRSGGGRGQLETVPS